MHAKYEVYIFYVSKVIAKVKVDNRQTDRQTDKQTNRQDKNNMFQIIRSGGIKSYLFIGYECKLTRSIGTYLDIPITSHVFNSY